MTNSQEPEEGLHVLSKGECIESLATRYGLTWQTVWDHPQNAELAALREDPNVLLEGDTVFVPSRRESEAPCSTDQSHRFVRKGVPSIFRLRLLKDGEARSGLAFELTIGSARHTGSTDGNGWLEVPIRPGDKSGKLVIEPGGLFEERTSLYLGGLDPVDEATGLQQRLENLGFECGEAGVIDEPTRAAIASFQEWKELEPDGKPTPATLAKLREVHGS